MNKKSWSAFMEQKTSFLSLNSQVLLKIDLDLCSVFFQKKKSRLTLISSFKF